jgi:hypothetical protein
MIGWSEIAPLLKSIFTSLAIDTTRPHAKFAAEWTEGQRSAISTEQKLAILMKLTTVVGIGRDETRRRYVDPSSTDPADAAYLGQQRVYQVGQRRFTIQVQAHMTERTDSLMAQIPLDRIRVGLRLPRILDQLHDAEVAHIRTERSIKANYKDGQRVVSAASMDVVFGAAFTYDDPIPGNWIEQISYSSHFADTDGTELTVPPNVTDFIVPPDSGVAGAAQTNQVSGVIQNEQITGVVDVRIPAGA